MLLKEKKDREPIQARAEWKSFIASWATDLAQRLGSADKVWIGEME